MSNRHSFTTSVLRPVYFVMLGLVQLSIVMLIVGLSVSAFIPLLCIVLIVVIAPFFPSWRIYVPVISRFKNSRDIVLTFDDGPSPELTPVVLEILKKYNIRATFFLTGTLARRNEYIVSQIIEQGHSIGNHTWSHDVLIMLKSKQKLRYEIEQFQHYFKERFSLNVRYFRPPVGITNPFLFSLLAEYNLLCVNFSCRAKDAGNRIRHNLAKKIGKKIKPGAIVLLHDNYISGMDIQKWISELETIIENILQKGYAIRSLHEVMNHPSAPATNAIPSTVVSDFYDNLAKKYDLEQFETSISRIRKYEYNLVSQILPLVSDKQNNVLEIGAGTGLYTLDLARLNRTVTAVDVSRNMLDVLEEKTVKHKQSNIEIVHSDIFGFQSAEFYDLAVSFSAIEYISDFNLLCEDLSRRLKPGSTILITTAHKSLFRFFAQIGNAMRQSVWLHARCKKEVRDTLVSNGFCVDYVEDYLYKTCFTKGILLAIKACKK
ncbi:MAG: polysaccharide deacetylase family protein [Spirochaetes bacterium]|jgi:peptidoglycan/xylan/chitin deacetylase (PgdA/CDA1 family)/ubiquinone/menaquinone biosynthesis C-methylase UbiE|nr:polysaccharide deacetylase family protein [Spirochaetota bacterium]